MDRVITYIDGFNLYFGLKSKQWKRYYWLDVHALSQNLLKPGQQLDHVNYFTSRVSSSPRDPHQDKRQATYIEALQTLPNTSVFFGHYLSKLVTCFKCGATWNTHEEKMTDVNIAITLAADAFQDKYDTAILISADSDLTGPIQQVRRLFPNKRIIVAFPPDRNSTRLRQEANAFFTIGRKTIQDSLLPDPVVKPDGFALQKPPQWS